MEARRSISARGHSDSFKGSLLSPSLQLRYDEESQIKARAAHHAKTSSCELFTPTAMTSSHQAAFVCKFKAVQFGFFMVSSMHEVKSNKNIS